MLIYYSNLNILMLCFRKCCHQNCSHFLFECTFLMMKYHLYSKSSYLFKWLFLVKWHRFQHALIRSFENLIDRLSFIHFVFILLSLFSFLNLFYLFFCLLLSTLFKLLITSYYFRIHFHFQYLNWANWYPLLKNHFYFQL
jgi:hypothetical protein